MDLRDYVNLLRRGAPTIVVAILLAGLAGFAYLQVTPQVYQSTAAVLVAPREPESVGELQLGGQYAVSSVPTIASVMGTAAVLEPAAQELEDEGTGAGLSAGALSGLVAVTPGEGSATLFISASAGDAATAAAIANAVGAAAADTVPELISSRAGADDPLLQITVTQPAEPPTAPVSPVTNRVMVLFLAVGLALGLAVTLVRQSLDNRLRRADDVTSDSTIPLLATLARERRGGRGVVVRDDPQSPVVEGFRVLRTNISALGSTPPRSTLVTAASADPLAVRVPVNLAWSFAQTGRRVLLVDVDLRHSSVAALVDVPASPGAADLLTGTADLDQVVRATSVANLDVLPAGEPGQAPSDLLTGPALESFLRRAEVQYDDVVIHAPALLSFTDAAVVAGAATQTVVVARAGHTRTPDLTRAVGVLANVGVTPLGLVLSGAKGTVSDNVRSRDLRAGGSGGDGNRRGARSRKDEGDES